MPAWLHLPSRDFFFVAGRISRRWVANGLFWRRTHGLRGLGSLTTGLRDLVGRFCFTIPLAPKLAARAL